MSDNITGFYRAVLALPRVDSQMQQQVFIHGNRRGDHQLLALLAARPDLDNGLDQRLGHIDAAVVKVAWASRPERSEDDLVNLVRTEQRVKVLAALASRDDLPAALYDAIAAHAKSSALEALLLNLSVAVDTKIVAARRYATQVKGKRLSSSISSLLAQEPQVAEEISAHTTNFRLGAAALEVIGSAASQEAMANVVQLAIAEMSDEDSYSDWETYNTVERVGEELLSNPSHDRELAKQLTQSIRKVSTEREGYPASRYKNIFESLSKIKPRKGSTIDLVGAARNASNEEEARALIGLFLSNKDEVTGPALVAAARNDAVDAEILYEVLQCSQYGWYISRDLMWAYPRLSAVKAAVVHVCMPWLNDDSLLSRHPEPAKVLMYTARLASKRNVLPTLLLNSRFLGDEVVDELPFSVFNAAEGIPLAVTERIAARVQSRLGDNQAAWETLGVLAPSFNGSVSELIEVAIRV